MLTNHQNDTRNLAARKATAVLEADWVEPDFGAIGVPFDMHVWRLGTVTREEEASVGARNAAQLHSVNHAFDRSNARQTGPFARFFAAIFVRSRS